MRRFDRVAVMLCCATVALAAQAPDKELVATLSGPALSGGIVSGLSWDEQGRLIIQTAAMQKDGTLSSQYFIVPGPRMQVQPLAGASPAVQRYWKMKSSRVGPNGEGKLSTAQDSKLPMYGIASQERRLIDAMDMGGAQVKNELKLKDLVLYRWREVAPYDGQVWGWSPPALNRIAYVDEDGNLCVARNDGTGAERVLKGKFTLPAWSEDGLALAVAERKNDGARWEISVIHLPEKYRQ